MVTMMRNPFSSTSSHISTVGLVQSDIEDASQFDYPEIKKVVGEAVSQAGGLCNIVKDGDTVVLKPNIVATRCNAGFSFLDFNAYRQKLQIPAEVNGITTDYRVTRAVVELVRDINPSGRVHVMEGSAWGSTARNFELMGYTHDSIPGVDSFISLDNTSSFGSTDSRDLVKVDLGDRGRYPVSKMPLYTGGSYYLDRTYFEADVLISIPVLKNHLYAGMTGGIKNVAIGATPCMLYGNSRKRIGRIKKIDHSWGPLNDWIHDYYLCRPVDFVVTDGLQGSCNGPRAQGSSSVEKTAMNMRLILGGPDAVAVDTVHSCIVGTDPMKVDHLRNLAAAGEGTIDTRFIVVRGNRRVDEVKKSFTLSRIMALLYRGRKAQYRDFKAPVFEVSDVELNGSGLTAVTRTGNNLAKLEIYLDGELTGTLLEGFDHIAVPLEGAGEVLFCAYDRYLNCTVSGPLLV